MQQQKKTDTIKKPDNLRPGEANAAARKNPAPAETGGPKGPEPTRYGDWERGGRCIDF